eukprot:366366-Chlamydomonas_euryale.AAC.14
MCTCTLDRALPCRPPTHVCTSLCSAASASQLAELIAAEAGCFDSVNVSHALSRLAKAAQASSGAAGARALRSSVLLPSAQLLLAQLPRVVGDFDAWDATLSLWSLGWLRLQDAAAIRALCRRARALVATFRPADCAMAVAGFARLGTADTQLLQVVPHVLMAQLDKVRQSACTRMPAQVVPGFLTCVAVHT